MRAFDKLPGQHQVDLAADQPFNDILDAARGGLVDGSHCACGSFSMARYNEGHGPPPVRSLEFIYGLPTNDVRQQAEADKGTMLALRSIQVTWEVIQTQRLRRVPECGTLENPPGSDGQKEGPSCRLPEMEDFLADFRCEVVKFNTCAFQMTEKVRWFKPGQFGGRLEGLKSLKRSCSCPKYYKHESLVGKEKTARAAKYPNQLAMEVARMVIKAFRTTLDLEWRRHQQKQVEKDLNEAKRNWVAAKEKNRSGPPLLEDKMKAMRGIKRAWNAEDLDKDKLPVPANPSKKRRREEENTMCLGGMRNPASSLKRLSGSWE